MSFGASWSIGNDLPRKFQMEILLILFGTWSRAVYTSLKRCKQLARSSSKFTYKTFPCVHGNPNHSRPSAMDIQRLINAKDLPALEGPAINILWPSRSTPSINGGAKSGILSQIESSSSGSGRSSFTDAIHSSHSL